MERVILAVHRSNKPIGALCIAPVILAKILDKVLITIGQDPATTSAIESMGAEHKTTLQGEVVVDTKQRIVTTPCYMLDSRVDQIGDGVDRLVQEVLKLL